MRTPSFEKQMLDFRQVVLDFIKEQQTFNNKVEKRLDAIEDKLVRNNIK